MYSGPGTSLTSTSSIAYPQDLWPQPSSYHHALHHQLSGHYVPDGLGANAVSPMLQQQALQQQLGQTQLQQQLSLQGLAGAAGLTNHSLAASAATMGMAGLPTTMQSLGAMGGLVILGGISAQLMAIISASTKRGAAIFLMMPSPRFSGCEKPITSAPCSGRKTLSDVATVGHGSHSAATHQRDERRS